jgi:hypothetical protein
MVRMLAEGLVLELGDRSRREEGFSLRLGSVVAQLEVARQLSLVGEDLRRVSRKLDELMPAGPAKGDER